LHGLRGGFDVLGTKKNRPKNCQDKHRPHPTLVRNPEEGAPVQENIAKGSPAKGGQEGNDGNADNIEPFGGARENSRCGKS
jgi:hypothetical protein